LRGIRESIRPNHIKMWPIVKLRPQEQDLVTSLVRSVGVEYVGWQRKRESLKDAKTTYAESRKVGPINGETTDDSIVDHIFLWSTGFPPQYYAASDRAHRTQGP
jgi:hypothetical protein